MPFLQFNAESLKTILEQIDDPGALDSHPWADAAFVQEFVTRNPNWEEASRGRQLAHALEEVFANTRPAVPPRRGKRLDTSWGEFGLLAALYFAPLQFGAPIPESFRDAWGRIDHSILLYTFGRADGVPAQQAQTYKLVGDELQVASNSTLSDWHRKGIQQLVEAVHARERFAQEAASTPNQAAAPGRSEAGKAPNRVRRKITWVVALSLFLLLLAWAGFKAWRIYNLAAVVWEDVNAMRGLGLTEPDVAALQAAGPKLSVLREDVHALHEEVEPLLWMGPLLQWVPAYGGELAEARNLLIMADSTLAATDGLYRAFSPLLDTIADTDAGSNFDLAKITQLMSDARPQLIEAQAWVEEAAQARERIDLERLSPRTREAMLLADKALPWMQDGIVIALEFPHMMGATDQGPKTYLLLAQNEDELRPTGGFITAAGTLMMQDAQIGNLTFQGSGTLDDWTKAYPSAPWQLHQYMNSEVLVLRDVNWFADYRVAALYAETFYAYQNDHSVDGVIVIDQHLLVELLRVTGPVHVEGSTELIGADGVVEYMRAQKIPPWEITEANSALWDNKEFINRLTTALLNRILDGGFELEQMMRVLLQMLDEHHILLQFDNPALTPVLVRRGWDGAIRPGTGDFLMAVDFNSGFNKTNAVVERRLGYEVNLSRPDAPGAQLSITHVNQAAKLPCLPEFLMTPILNEIEKQQYAEENYPINRCYWAYVRVYTAPGTELLDANPQTISGETLLSGFDVPPQVDALGREEELQGVQGFGFLKLVQGGETVETNLRFGLPAFVVVQEADGSWKYQLRVQKQPGTVAVPFVLRVQLPTGAVVQSMPEEAVFENGTVVLQTDLQLDLNLEILFTVP
ncbi:MAG: hypothetical protein HFACDABA_02049 [Anaerolineales bacterium]|nr:hypothetical protein [Anaerolineales bacterium]